MTKEQAVAATEVPPRLTGQVIVLTGAGGGIGRVWARRLVREQARLALIDVNAEALERVAESCRSMGGDVVTVVADLTRLDAVRRAVDQAASALGGIDAVVNNAALFSQLQYRPFDEIPEAEIDLVFSVNVKGPLLVAQAAAPHLRRRGRGRVVNVASGAILSVPSGLAHYVISKGAVFTMTRVLARELGPYGINVNSIAPGLTMTETSQHPENPVIAARNARCLPRDEVPEDLEGTLVFLLSRDSDFVTGQMIVVNGGAQFW